MIARRPFHTFSLSPTVTVRSRRHMTGRVACVFLGKEIRKEKQQHLSLLLMKSAAAFPAKTSNKQRLIHSVSFSRESREALYGRISEGH